MLRAFFISASRLPVVKCAHPGPGTEALLLHCGEARGINFSLYDSSTSNDLGRLEKPCPDRGFDNIFHVGSVENAR
jgi:hypothetical protein